VPQLYHGRTCLSDEEGSAAQPIRPDGLAILCRNGIPFRDASKAAGLDSPVAGDPTVTGMPRDNQLRIGELARLTGLQVKTIRFWSDEGLVPPDGRTPASYRLYS